MVAWLHDTQRIAHCNAKSIVYHDTMRIMDNRSQTPAERFRSLRRKRFESAEDFARRVGLAGSTVRAHENGTRGITSRVAAIYARHLKSTPEAILYGKGFNQDTVNTTINTPQAIAPTAVPLLDCLDVEQFRSIVSGGYPMSEELTFVGEELACGKRTFSTKVNDKSMEGAVKEAIYEGEIAIIDPDKAYAAGEIVAAIAPGFDGIILRKYRLNSFAEEGHAIFDLVPINPDYPSVLNASVGNVQIVGRVIGALRKF